MYNMKHEIHYVLVTHARSYWPKYTTQKRLRIFLNILNLLCVSSVSIHVYLSMLYHEVYER